MINRKGKQREGLRPHSDALRSRCVRSASCAEKPEVRPTDIRYVEIFPEVATLKFVDPQSEVVTRAFNLVKPIDLPELYLREQLALMMSEVRIAHLDNRLPAQGPTKKQVEKVEHALKRVKQAIKGVPPHARVAQSIYWNDFCRLIDEVVCTVEHHHNGIVVGKGARLLDVAKLEAAEFARKILGWWKNVRPTKTIDGTFYELASVMYEGGTGIAGADLQRFCRLVVDCSE